MLIYTLKRFLYVLPVALGVSLVCFMLVHIAPGDPLTAVLPVDASAEMQQEMRARLRLRQAAARAIRPLDRPRRARATSAPPSPRAGR